MVFIEMQYSNYTGPPRSTHFVPNTSSLPKIVNMHALDSDGNRSLELGALLSPHKDLESQCMTFFS